jgi:hypothetical protein
LDFGREVAQKVSHTLLAEKGKNVRFEAKQI